MTLVLLLPIWLSFMNNLFLYRDSEDRPQFLLLQRSTANRFQEAKTKRLPVADESFKELFLVIGEDQLWMEFDCSVVG